ncbi:uncharacterized protein LOC114295406 [Camellia sinensis]|uniref:uncharacterized protein LOC114295406 n=1 Tax=Camellia sinensis TaxID=4442 RepID=UPI001035AE62|nr:uncharacterized protein LOC114295406 [Camellia sinensis]
MASFYGNKSTTLDLLGLGIGAGGAFIASFSALFTSIGSGLDVAIIKRHRFECYLNKLKDNTNQTVLQGKKLPIYPAYHSLYAPHRRFSCSIAVTKVAPPLSSQLPVSLLRPSIRGASRSTWASIVSTTITIFLLLPVRLSSNNPEIRSHIYIILVYEETAGLTVNDPILRTHKPLLVELGPGILGNIFDGIQRPLKTIAKRSGDVYIPRGVSVPALDKDTLWEFQPKKIGEGGLVIGGDLYAIVFEDSLAQHHVALPPDSIGKITSIAPVGQYSLKVCLIYFLFLSFNVGYSLYDILKVKSVIF